MLCLSLTNLEENMQFWWVGSMLQAPLHVFMSEGVNIPLTLFTSEAVLSAQQLSALLAALAINVSRIAPDQTAPNPRVCTAISTFWKLLMFHSAHL